MTHNKLSKKNDTQNKHKNKNYERYDDDNDTKSNIYTLIFTTNNIIISNLAGYVSSLISIQRNTQPQTIRVFTDIYLCLSQGAYGIP